MIDVLYAFMQTQVLAAFVRLGLGQILVSGPQTLDGLSQHVGADPDALSRLLRALLRLDVVAQDESGRFRLGPVGVELAPGPSTVGQLADYISRETYEAWGDLVHSIRTGAPAFDLQHGSNYFDWLDRDPMRQRRFSAAMADSVSSRLEPLRTYPFPSGAKLIDVGGGDGTMLMAVLELHPSLSGVLLEQPAVAQIARDRLSASALAARMTVEEGSFFDALPPDGDVYLLAQVLHDWDDENAVRILRQCREALHRNATVLVLESVLSDDAASSLMDLNMLVMLGGRERSLPEWGGLAAEADLRVVTCLEGERAALIELQALPNK